MRWIFSKRAVPFWTAVGAIAAVGALLVTLFGGPDEPRTAADGPGAGSPESSGPSQEGEPTQSSPPPVVAPTAGPPATPQPTRTYLADMDRVSGVPFSESITLSGTRYPFSVVMYCTDSGLSLTYNVAGRTGFSATVGIPDDEDALGDTIDVWFYDQDKRELSRVDVSLARPSAVSFGLNGVVQLEIFCMGRDFGGGRTRGIGLGDAAVTS